MIKKILFNLPNKLKAFYLLWLLLNLSLLLFNTKEIVYAFDSSKNPHNSSYRTKYDRFGEELDKGSKKNEYIFTSYESYFTMVDIVKEGNNWIIPHSRVFYPFTSPELLNIDNIVFYDLTEFIFYTSIPIFIFVIIKLFITNDNKSIQE